MVLSDVDIRRYMAQGKIKISPELPPEQFGSCSVDFRLGNEFNVFEHSRNAYIDLRESKGIDGIMQSVRCRRANRSSCSRASLCWRSPKKRWSWMTMCWGAWKAGRSLGRIGIIVHGTAGLFDPGWAGKATLELSNLGRMPVALYPGMRICSFTFEQLSTPSSMPYRQEGQQQICRTERVRSRAGWRASSKVDAKLHKAVALSRLSPLPPEKCAFALARYSRSPDSIRDSLDWVRTHDSAKFLESFYFQYGHASIADLGHVVLCFEGISELAATEIEDEQLWDGQARSSRYQDFSKSGFVTPPEFDAAQAAAISRPRAQLLDGLQRDPRESFRSSGRKTSAAGGHEAGSVPAQFEGAGVRRGALSVVLWHSDRRGASDQHSHAGAAGAAAEGLGISRSCAAWRTKSPRPARRSRACDGMERRASEAVAPTLARHLDADEHANGAATICGPGRAEPDRTSARDHRSTMSIC